MTWPEALGWLYSTQQFGIKLGLENTYRLLEATGRPDARLKFLHVAGTNGKGSVCAMIDAMLRAAGFRIGLYTSPHLIDFRERIRVNGEPISQTDGACILSSLRATTSTWPHAPTFFELTTVLALRHFADTKVNFVVLETGMGGRLDSTNAVKPEVSIITPIAIDHAQWLGDTIEKITAEKAGILKPCVPAVSAPQEAVSMKVLQTAADKIGVSLRFISKPVTIPINLKGSHQQLNAALAIEALRSAKIKISDEAIRSGLKSVQWPGRFQQIGPFVLDGAHNPHASTQLVKTWHEVFDQERAIVIFGALRDKTYPDMLEKLACVADEFWLVPLRNVRAESPERLGEVCPFPHRIFATLEEALTMAYSQTKRILITGSLFLVGEVLNIITTTKQKRN